MTTSKEHTSDGGAAVSGRAGARPGRLLVERTVLDEQVAASRGADPRAWGVRGWLGPILALVLLVGAGNVAGALLGPRTESGLTGVDIALTAAIQLLLLAALLAFGRKMAARGGGWRATFGLDRIRAGDWAPFAFGLMFVFAGRMVVGTLAAVLTHGHALAEASNLQLARPTAGAVVALAIVAVVVAPVTEELMFRGLVLRTFMRRLSFWPAAALSTVLFAVFHMYEARTVAGAVTLACSVAVLGLGNCYLVRISGRLAPAMMVHASFNALAVVLTVLVASH